MQRPASQLCYFLGPRFTQWLYSAETLCRVTPYQILNYVADKMLELYGANALVWAMHANLGNEAALLVEHGFRLVCSEDQAAALCRRNLENAGLGTALQLRLDVHIDQPDEWPEADVVLLNPPWGQSYERQRKQHFDLGKLRVGEQSFLELFDAVRERYGSVVVISPARSVRFDQQRPADQVLEFTKLRILFYKTLP